MESISFRRAFTLIELLVVLAIIGIIMVIVLVSQSSFNKTLILTNTAYDIALSLRDAESYGLGSRAVNATASAGYGVHFQNASPGSFILFADTYPPVNTSICSRPDCEPGDNVYTSGSDALVQTYTLGNGITISNFCALSNSVWSCENSTSGGLTSLDIVFARPNPNAFMSVNGSYSALSPITAACITVTSPQGGFKYVSVAASGEITANATSCP